MKPHGQCDAIKVKIKFERREQILTTIKLRIP